MIGQTISHYRIISELGRGGMGIVYRAEDTKLMRTVAIKVLPATALANEDDRARFYREARAAASLTHPHIAVVHEIDEAVPSDAPHGTQPSPFIAMEFIEGETLDARIKRGPLKLEEAVRIASEVASALEAAHEKNVVHRDIKSANVMLTAKGEAKVLDFGLAQTAQSTKLTKMGSTVGTIGYMSPEQARGEDVDRRTDIWSLGVVLYEMISGRHPFPGEYEQAVVYEILNAEPEPLTAVRTGVPMALEWIVSKMLAKAAKARYQSTAEILVDLEAVDLRSPSGFSRVSTAAVPVPGQRRARKIGVPFVGVLILAAAVLTALAMSFFRPSPETSRLRYVHLNVSQKDLGSPALSPDGDLLAFIGRNELEDRRKLHVYNFISGELISIDESQGAREPVFSPDGEEIAYRQGRNIMKVSSAGGVPLPVVGGVGREAVWGADGEIYYSDLSGQVMRVEGAGEQPSPLLSPDTSKGRALLFPFGMIPDTRLLLVDEEVNSLDDNLMAVNIDDRTIIPILEKVAYTAKYAPSGHLVYVQGSSGPLFARTLDPQTLKLGPVTPVKQNVSATEWTFSASGVFANIPSSSKGRLLQVDSRGRKIPFQLEEASIGAFRVSPTGTSIVSSVWSVGSPGWQLFIYTDSTASFRQIPRTDGSNYDPAWSPDGERIVFVSWTDDKRRLVVRQADGSGSSSILFESEKFILRPDWSSDGNSVVFAEGLGRELAIWHYSFADGHARRLVDESGKEFSVWRPRFSPNSKFIAFNNEGRQRLSVISADGSSQWVVTSAGGAADPAWSNDGTRLFFRRGLEILEVPVETDPTFSILGDPRPVYSSAIPFSFDVLPDGNGFVIAEDAGVTGEYFEIVFNWFEELERLAPHSK